MSGKARKSKIKSQNHESDGELWLISYADMVTLLLGFFVILYSFSTIDSKKFAKVTDNMSEALTGDERTSSESKASEIDEDLKKLHYLSMMVSMAGMGSVEDVVGRMKSDESREEMVRTARSLMDSKMALSQDGTLDLAIPSKTMFIPGSAEITPGSYKQLAKIVNYIKKVEGLVDIQIVGHTDSSPINKSTSNKFSNNWELSAARAGAVAKALEEYGIDAKYLKPSGVGSTRPLFPEIGLNGRHNAENMRKNRRVHIKLKKRSSK
jgi:chemotaxis protein MotB